MYFSRFNYVSDHEKDGQRLLMNFLSRSCDIVDDESASAFLEKKDTLSAEEKEYCAERGYLYRSETEETKVLEELRGNEAKSTKTVVLLDRFDNKKDVGNVLNKVTQDSSLVLYNEESLNSGDVVRSQYLPEDTALVTVSENLSYFEEVLKKKLISKVSLILPLSTVSRFEEDTEALFDFLIEHEITVEVIARLQENDVQHIKPLMDYFIYKGWPFLDNFMCNVEPQPNKGCIFGYWYDSIDLSRRIFQEYKTYPQTEFCSMGKWVGINAVDSLIWIGKPSRPSCHFCEATKGLTVISGTESAPCFHMVTSGIQKGLQENEKCQTCVFGVVCGGGCRLQHECPPVKELIEIALEFYFDEFLQRLNYQEEYGVVQ
jgi:hypothetical protein